MKKRGEEVISISNNTYLYEVSWEVCNKVGGIYTVVKSKISPVVERFGDRYTLIGPYFPNKAIGEFQEKLAPDTLKKIFDKLKNEGIICHYGRWIAKGDPQVILIDFAGFVSHKNELKKQYYELFKIDSLATEYNDYDEPIIWGSACGRLIEEIKSQTSEKIVVHCHEWLSAGALLYLKSRKVAAATVFTTHATTLGRTMSSNNINIYDSCFKINTDEASYRYGVYAKHQTEKACAVNADVFSTVSEITGIEAERILNKKPDIILPNGLDLSKFPTFEEISVKHSLFKNKIKEFIMYYFFPHYTFNLDETLIYFICGRYEFHDKGIDIFIEALAKLNQKLKEEGSKKTIVAFFWIPGNIRGIKPELLESKTFYEDIKDTVKDNADNLLHRIIYLIMSSKNITKEGLFSDDEIYELKSKTSRLIKNGITQLCTHDLFNESDDQILAYFKKFGLLNSKDDRVKVVFYPIYLTGADGLLDLNYYECMLGSHLGVFASFYEPWGYTPLEGASLGISSVTTDLAGFGRYVSKNTTEKNYPGVFVLKRFGVKDADAATNLSHILHSYSLLTKEERIKNKMEAKKLSALADWKNLVNNYMLAYELALKKMK